MPAAPSGADDYNVVLPRRRRPDKKSAPPENASHRSASGRPRARKPLLVGKKVSDGRMSWKGADLTSNYYVGHINIDADPEVIKSDIASIGVKVIEFEELERKHNRFKSFRLCIRKSDETKLLTEDFWPEEVVLDKFFRGKSASGPRIHSNAQRGTSGVNNG